MKESKIINMKKLSMLLSFVIFIQIISCINLSAEENCFEVNEVSFLIGQEEIFQIAAGQICVEFTTVSQVERTVNLFIVSYSQGEQITDIAIAQMTVEYGTNTYLSPEVMTDGETDHVCFILMSQNLEPCAAIEVLNGTQRVDNSDEAISLALQKLDSKFSKETLDWFINQYDTVSGGYFFAPSSRDYGEFAADIESTVQAISIIKNMGLQGGGTYGFSEDYRNKAISFLQSRQDIEDGYFYDPQFKPTNSAKRDRNTMFAVASLRTDLKSTPLYPTPEERMASQAILLSVDERFRSEENFLAWLEEIYINRPNSYFWGSDLSAAKSMIEAAGYTDILIEWLLDKQYANGSWEETFDDVAVNGILKISGFFNTSTVPYPNFEVMMNNMIEYSLEFTPASASHIWNPLGAMRVAINSYGGNVDGAVKRKLKKSLAQIISNVADKMDIFLMPDYGYGYYPSGSSIYSNDVVVGLGLKEGDVNALSMMTLVYVDAYNLANKRCSYVWSGYKDYFWEKIAALEPFEKQLYIAEVFNENFEDIQDNLLPSEFVFKGGHGEICNENGNKYLKLKSYSDSRLNMVIRHSALFGNKMQFEADILVPSGVNGNMYNLYGSSLFQWYIIRGTETYFISHSNWSDSSYGDKMMENLEYDRWYNIKIEYIPGESKETTFINYYLNGELCGTSSSYYRDGERLPAQLVDSMTLNGFNGSEGCLCCIDNVVLKSVS